MSEIDDLIEKAKRLVPIPSEGEVLCRWYNKPKWVYYLYPDGRYIFCSIKALSIAYGKESARNAVLEAEKNESKETALHKKTD